VPFPKVVLRLVYEAVAAGVRQGTLIAVLEAEAKSPIRYKAVFFEAFADCIAETSKPMAFRTAFV
jgi:hypothetical protein